MGILLSRVRKKKSTIETLEKLDNDIKEIEENRVNNQRKYKKITKLLLVYSLGLYVVCGIIFYFQYTSSLKGKLLYLVPLAISPLILYIVKIIISWYYVRLINKNQIRLNEMKKEKKRILEEVMDKETYKVAKEILEKFSATEPAPKPNSNLLAIPKADDGIRKRIVRGASSFTSTSVQPPNNMLRGGGNQIHRPVLPGSIPLKALPGTPKMLLPAPILPLQRSYVDRVVEYLIGDGLNNRYALICSNCHSHNGMALKEEFEYISYKCCYCYFYNPARKVRPEAPKLEGTSKFRRVSDSDSEKTSGESSDADNKTPSVSANINTSSASNDVDLNNSELGAKNDEDLNNSGSDVKKETDVAPETETQTQSENELATEDKISSSQPESDANCDESLAES